MPHKSIHIGEGQPCKHTTHLPEPKEPLQEQVKQHTRMNQSQNTMYVCGAEWSGMNIRDEKRKNREHWGKSDEILMEFIPWRGGHKGGTNSIEMRNKTELLLYSTSSFCWFALLCFGFLRM